MSLLIADPRSRGKSPGRERSRSRSAQPPPPPQPVKQKAKKYYESDSSEVSADSDRDHHTSSRGRREEPKYEKANVKPRRRRDDSDSDSESEEKGVDPRRRREDPRQQHGDERHRRASSPPKMTTTVARSAKHSQSERQEQEYKDGRHPSYADPNQYEYGHPEQLTRHASYPNQGGHPQERQEHGMPGAFNEDYDHPESRERGFRPPPTTRPEQTRHMSLNTSGSFHVDLGHGQPQHQGAMQYMQPATTHPGQYATSPIGQRPPQGYYPTPVSSHDPHRAHSQSVSSQGTHYAAPEKFQYAQPSHEITYIKKTDHRHNPQYVQTAHPQVDLELEIETRRPHHKEKVDNYDKYDKHDEKKPARSSHSRPQVVEIHPGGASLGAPSTVASGMHRLSVSGQRPQTLSLVAPGGNHNHNHTGGLPPGSPLLEAYHGTWQDIGMPSPMHLPSHLDDDDLSDLEPLQPKYSPDDSSDGSDRRKPKKSILKKRVEIYDPEPDALALAASLKHTKPDIDPIIEILPHLSDDNILAIRAEYKKHIKVSGKGINIAKHIKLKVTGNIGKIAYATALGRWESEAHWANFWYQTGTSRRELLIESLMGRTNSEIRKIKEAFQDKRYNDSLEKCMQTELKKDKFRNAVLLALEERRQDELAPLSKSRIKEDVKNLYGALVSKEGGETAMIEIIVVRSDTHLREVLREFEARYERNFAREMIQKSRNLVGETLAHILNGVLNRPVRDALLIHQALAETSKDRTELLISRLVRFHWEPKHLERIKTEYKRKYGNRMDRDVEEGTKGEFGEFCLALCEGKVR